MPASMCWRGRDVGRQDKNRLLTEREREREREGERCREGDKTQTGCSQREREREREREHVGLYKGETAHQRGVSILDMKASEPKSVQGAGLLIPSTPNR